jgi:leader peptidase (prepilin peptidase)/N-methyltransferase
VHVYLTTAAAVWGLATGGLALPRAAYRLSVEPDLPWRDARGWLGRGPGGVPLAVVCAVACAAVALRVGARPELGVWLLLVPAGALMARVDLAVLRLPDVLTLPAGAVMSAGLGVCALLTLYFLLHLINPAGMGFGDVKLAPALGMALGWYGWGAVLAGTFAGFALGAVAGLTLLALRRADRKTAIPFGPFMLLGALGGVLLAAGW